MTTSHIPNPRDVFSGEVAIRSAGSEVFLPPQTDIIESPDINNGFAKLWPSDLQLRCKSAKLFIFENSSNLSLPNVAAFVFFCVFRLRSTMEHS